MLKNFPNLYNKIGKKINLELTFHVKKSKKISIKMLSKLFRRKRHYYVLNSIKGMVRKLGKSNYFLEIELISDKKRYHYFSGNYEPNIKKYSETEFYINN